MSFLLAPLTTADDARAYLAALVANRLDYHLDDAAAGMIDGRTGRPLFTPEQAALADLRAAECAALLEDPCAELMEIAGGPCR